MAKEKNSLVTLRWLSCGHVDDGKSTLMGALWYGMGAVPHDAVKLHEPESDNLPAAQLHLQQSIDYAALLDGLDDEQAQGITIDVAWRFARYNGQYWILADTPGHHQYTRNMAVAASYSDGALLVLDAQHGIREQTRRHAAILDFFAVPHRVVVINKMDLIGYDQKRFDLLASEVRELLSATAEKGTIPRTVTIIPACALKAEMVTSRTEKLSWYSGPTVLEAVQSLTARPEITEHPALFVQSAVRTDSGRAYLGSLWGGKLDSGDALGVAGREKELTASIKELWRAGVQAKSADGGDAVALILDRELDLSRGAVLAKRGTSFISDEFLVGKILWLDPAIEHQTEWRGLLKIHHQETQSIVSVKAASGIVVTAEIETGTPIICLPAVEPTRANEFLLIDSETTKTVGVGFISRGGAGENDIGFSI